MNHEMSSIRFGRKEEAIVEMALLVSVAQIHCLTMRVFYLSLRFGV